MVVGDRQGHADFIKKQTDPKKCVTEAIDDLHETSTLSCG